jgi:predicted  nucleic acid-binding Zn-ribbon protein
MSDVGRELSELRQEVVESRNQAIKTDNQVKNLTLDIRSFEKRFDGIDRRVRLTHLGAYGLLTAVVGLAACVVITVRSKSYEDELRRVHAKGDEEQITAVRQVEAANKHLADADASTQAYQQASKLAGQIFDLLDANQEQQAGELLDKLPFDTLSPLERRLSS